jgi:hypothetical protein
MAEEPIEITQEMIDEYEEAEAEKAAEADEDRMQRAQEFQEGYGYPTPDEKHNQHTFLNKAAFDSTNTVRTTFLDKEEIGKPLFSVRFLLDMEDVANHYINPIADHLSKNDKKAENRISQYFFMKVLNITDSGMSKEGFAMNLNVTKKMDTTRRKLSAESLKNLKRRK